MDRVYTEAYALRAPRVLGVQLLPLSLGHVLLLHAIHSPFVEPGAMGPGAGDLARAVWICSRLASTLRKGAVDEARLLRATRRWVRKAGRMDFAAESAVFQDYFAAFCRSPERWEKPGAKDCAVAWPYAIALAIRPALGGHATLDDAFDCPVNHACCIFAAIGAAAGDDSLMNETEKSLAAAMEREP